MIEIGLKGNFDNYNIISLNIKNANNIISKINNNFLTIKHVLMDLIKIIEERKDRQSQTANSMSGINVSLKENKNNKLSEINQNNNFIFNNKLNYLCS